MYVRGHFNIIIACALLVVAFADTACVNGRSTRRQAVTSGDPASPIGPDDPGDPQSALQLSRAVRNPRSPDTLIDIIGKDEGVIGNYCKPDPAASAKGASTCVCSFTYVRQFDGAVPVRESFEVPTVYVETNLLRCSRAGIPADASQFAARVRVTAPNNFYSNTILVPIGAGAPLDLELPTSFVKPERFLCKDIVSIPYMLDSRSGVYDPFQSEDESVSYPLNFYSSNFGRDMSFYSAQNVTQFNCSSRPTRNDDQDRPLRIYSIAPDNGSYQIYPSTGGFDRHTFYLARANSGIFNVPVNSYVAPRIPSSTGAANGAPTPLGYGVRPTVNGEVESCPSQVPKDFKWVKVWLFRASARAGKFLTSENFIKMGAVTCNPGTFDEPINVSAGVTRREPVYKDCNIYSDADGDGLPDRPTAINATGNPANLLTPGGLDGSNGGLADRILSNNGGATTGGAPMCVNLNNPRRRINGVLTACAGTGAGCAQRGDLASSADVWEPRQGVYRCTPNLGLNPPDAVNPDFAQLCNPPESAIPFDAKVTAISLRSETRFDFLYVVTPATVNIKDMREKPEVAEKYTPFRYLSAADCEQEDPTDASCTANSGRRLDYGLKLHDIASGGDAPAPLVFPVCALQPK